MKHYDIVIIGAGIHGAAVARHAAAEGYKCLIIEQYDRVAQGTSSRSSKLIHGGLRYLESAQFSLVHECLRERKILLNNLPSLVTLVPFYIPVYKNSSRSWLKIFAGLFLYKILGGGPFRVIRNKNWSSLDHLSCENLKAVFQYYDAQTDDVALTKAVIRDAEYHGCSLLTGVKVINIECASQPVIALDNGDKVTARVVINASGPWISTLLKNSKPEQVLPALDLVQGAHIVVNAKLEQGIYYIEAVDGRVVFAMPWKGQVMIGTTETIYEGDPACVMPLPSEINYLLNTWNTYFSDSLTQADVADSFAGLRVLPASNKSAFSRSRDTQLICDNKTMPKVISIAGGKLTSHRYTAAQVMTLVHKVIKPVRKIDTATLKFN